MTTATHGALYNEQSGRRARGVDEQPVDEVLT